MGREQFMAVAGWWTETCGSRNTWRGEYDSCLYLIVFFGVPVWISARGCVHAIDLSAINEGERRDKIRSFVMHYPSLIAEAKDPEDPIYIPLRRIRLLQFMGYLVWFVWCSGIFGLAAVFDTVAILCTGRALTPGEPGFLMTAWTAFILFVITLILYQKLCRPSLREAGIRSVVARRLGPYSDPAEWERPRLVQFANLAKTSASPVAVLSAAEHQVANGHFEEGLLLARIAIGLTDTPEEDRLREDAERVADDCLNHLDRSRDSDFQE
jgi:hypothetical protein